MIKLATPTYDFDDVFNNCLESLATKPGLKARLSAGKADLDAQITTYSAKAQVGELYTLVPLSRSSNSNPTVVSGLKKSELLNLYEAYLRDKDRPGRVIYDELLASASGNCPYCGGIGRPRNLDHYLPKSKFPQYSLFPKNLVPSCRDCNMDGKGQSFSASAEKQVIHPFFDSAHFFEEQWIFGEYNPLDEPSGSVEFFADPPDHWSQIDKERVKTHFDDFELGVRYSKEAGARLVSLKPTIENLANLGIASDEIERVVIRPLIDNSFHTNHWECVMGLAISEVLKQH